MYHACLENVNPDLCVMLLLATSQELT